MATNLPARRGGAWSFPFDLMALPWQTMLGQQIKIEDFIEGDSYVLRAELPGFNVEHDVRLHVADGVLRIHAERSSEHKETAHSEFHYGAMTRLVNLPPGAKEDTVAATYRDGILEIRVELGEPAERGHQVPVKVI